MSPPDVVLVTGSDMPVPDSESPLVAAAMTKSGWTAEIQSWRDPYPWGEVPLVVCRTTWDYTLDLERFLTWCDDVAAVTRLVNGAEVIRWNAHKSYLSQLAQAGLPVVPTRLVALGARPDELAAALTGHDQVVIKPAVSAGGRGTALTPAGDAAAGEHLHELTRHGDALVQPLVESVPAWGETSLLHFGGVFSHAVRKVPALGDFRVHEHYGGTVVAHEPSPAELALAHDALTAAPGPTVYARIDLARGPDGPLIMEVELIEPFLFLNSHPAAVDRFTRVLSAARG